MPFIAIIGAGAIGGTLAHTLATRGRVSEVRLIDPAESIAQGKALDIAQAAPIENFSTRLTAAASIAAAAGATAIVVADPAAGPNEHSGEEGLALLRQLAAVETTAPFVFPGAEQRQLLARAASEIHVPRGRLIGSAPVALESSLRALVGLALDASGVEVQLCVAGVPPSAAVVAWEEAAAFGQPLRSQLAAHEMAAIAARIPGLWPPAAYTLASAAARIVEAIANGSRRRFSCFAALDAGPRRHAVAAIPVVLGPQGIVRVVEPVLTRVERTALENALERA
jgi:malate dehydrogenase